MITGKNKTPEMQYKIDVQKRLNAIRKVRHRKRLWIKPCGSPDFME
ncbi:MAG: hypothetical protein IKU01_10990 [Bacteroidales bacterium]|nr:hypothetical protein [Bacteroidales bacterium]